MSSDLQVHDECSGNWSAYRVPASSAGALGAGLRILKASNLYHAGDVGDVGDVWHVTRGVLRLSVQADDGPTFVQLALPGDLVGAESLFAGIYASTTTAVISSEVARVDLYLESQRSKVLEQALSQSHLRAFQAMSLRQGTIAERLSRLLATLEQATGESPQAMRQWDFPQLKEIAFILNSTTESVCRAMKQLCGPRGDIRLVHLEHRISEANGTAIS